MTTRDQLLRRILEDPADTTARLVYADLLEEQGEADRAEFIRAQCQPGELDRHASAWPRWVTLWHAPVRGFTDRLPGPDWHYLLVEPAPIGTEPWALLRGGFVEKVVCGSPAWLDHGPAVVAQHPVTQVTLTDYQLARHPEDNSLIMLPRPERTEEALSFSVPPWGAYQTPWFFAGEAEARQGLSRACVNWARDQASLPRFLSPRPAFAPLGKSPV
jgi:uncharacterized protein (TIGR02996 family)